MATSKIRQIPNNGVKFRGFDIAKGESQTFNITVPIQIVLTTNSFTQNLKGEYIINLDSSYNYSIKEVAAASDVAITSDSVNHMLTVTNNSTTGRMFGIFMYMGGDIT